MKKLFLLLLLMPIVLIISRGDPPTVIADDVSSMTAIALSDMQSSDLCFVSSTAIAVSLSSNLWDPGILPEETKLLVNNSGADISPPMSTKSKSILGPGLLLLENTGKMVIGPDELISCFGTNTYTKALSEKKNQGKYTGLIWTGSEVRKFPNFDSKSPVSEVISIDNKTFSAT